MAETLPSYQEANANPPDYRPPTVAPQPSGSLVPNRSVSRAIVPTGRSLSTTVANASSNTSSSSVSSQPNAKKFNKLKRKPWRREISSSEAVTPSSGATVAAKKVWWKMRKVLWVSNNNSANNSSDSSTPTASAEERMRRWYRRQRWKDCLEFVGYVVIGGVFCAIFLVMLTAIVVAI
jgi:hypothetical protein